MIRFLISLIPAIAFSLGAYLQIMRIRNRKSVADIDFRFISLLTLGVTCITYLVCTDGSGWFVVWQQIVNQIATSTVFGYIGYYKLLDWRNRKGE